ncbi:large ribosomal subunit protein bL19m-like [Oscarella lobularis]|uniref:large ribosomal subunit protein bL19m-like n=1 Tax=Oscarella lobularis TaxID=121494 RepID=UPI0033143744
MGTNLVDFLDRTDMHRRRTRIAIPDFCAGSYVAVTCSDPFAPKGETRFVGICIARRNSRLASNFTLRNVVGGEPVEMTYDLYSPRLQNIEVLKLERRRRAKLYYLRNRPAKQSTVSEHMPKTEPVQGRLPPRKTKR